MATYNVHHMPMMDWSGDNLSHNYQRYRDKLQLYFEDKEITDKKKQARNILRTIGDNGLIYGSPLTNDKKDPEKLFTFFESQLHQTVVNFKIQ